MDGSVLKISIDGEFFNSVLGTHGSTLKKDVLC